MDELDRAKISVQEVEEAIQSLKTNTSRAGDRKKLEALERKRVKLLSRMKNNPERISPLDERIFPGTFAPVVLQKNTNRKISCMRYRIRMPNGDEIPSKYNVFNARIDSLLKAPSWRSLFGKNHAIFPFQKFFEWVERDQKKCEISFFPDQKQLMWAASLFSEPKDGSYSSFAMITDEPPPEIAEAGHDRCPVFLDQREFTKWLSPQSRTPQELGNILRNKEKAFYFNSLTA